MNRKRTLGLALLLGLPVAAWAAAWDIDSAHSTAEFKVRHLMVSNVKGSFGKVSGMVQYDPADPTKATVVATIDAASLDTRVEDRDNHLKSPDFLDVAKHPAITFKSTKVEKSGDGTLKVAGDLTIHGVTKQVTLDVTGPHPEIKDPWGNVKSGASAMTKINRQDFGVLWNKTLDGGGVVVGNEVEIALEVELVKKK